MTSAHQFLAEIQGATKKKAFGLVKPQNGKTMIIHLAIDAWERSVAGRSRELTQAAYLYQVIKNCRNWIKLKEGKTDGSAPARRRIIQRVLKEAIAELFVRYPEIHRALGIYDKNKQIGARYGPALEPFEADGTVPPF